MKDYSKWSKKKIELEQHRLSGKTLEEIGMLYGISRQRVFQILNHNYENIRKGRPIKPIQMNLINKKDFSYNLLTQRDKYFYRKESVLTYYGNGKYACVRCGFDDSRALSIDHINGGGCKHKQQISNGEMYKWLMDNNYPSGYRTLCMNCQWITKSENNFVRKPSKIA